MSQALVKAQNFCVYQERYQQEVRDKIYEWGLHKADVESIIAELISENFISEERYAKAFAGGKFRIKKWGRVKIKMELKKRHLSDYCINKGLKEINDKDYTDTIKKIIQKKSLAIGEKNAFKKKHQIGQYLISRGFEPDIVWGEMGLSKI